MNNLKKSVVVGTVLVGALLLGLSWVPLVQATSRSGMNTGAQIKIGGVDTDKLAAGSVDTAKLNFAVISTVDSGKIVCIKSGNLRQFGTCSTGSIGISICNCQ